MRAASRMALLALTWLGFPALALAATPPPPAAGGRAPESTRKPVTYSFTLESRYDDNVLQLTADEIRRFENNPRPGRFLISSVDDRVTIARGALRWRTRPFKRRETEVAVGADVYRFQQNDIKNWHHFELGVTQELTASKHHLATLRAWAGYTPRYYLRQLTDADASFAAGRRIRRTLDYAQVQAGLGYRQELVDDRLNLSLSVERVRRAYNANFSERDNDRDQARLVLEGRPFQHWGLRLGVEYVAGRLDARGDLASSPIPDADISYRHHGLGGLAVIPWGHGRGRGRMEIEWLPEAREYTTSDKFDTRRFHRINRRRELDLRLTQHLWGPVDVSVSAERLRSDAEFTDAFDLPADSTDFEQNTISVGLRARLDGGR